jgi:ribonuclease P/MRP protein subunit RPP1
VDILCHPYLNRNDPGIDHICVRAAYENNVAIEVNFNTILTSHNRAKTLTMVRRVIELCKKYGTPIITASGAYSVWEMRAPRELVAITHILGLDISKAIESISTIPENIIVTNKEKLKNKRVGDYMRVISEGEYDTSSELNNG